MLSYVGGKVSPEMEIPKCLWIFKHLPEKTTKRIAKLFDLADFLTFRATGTDVRSLCTVVCKWNFMGHDQYAFFLI